MNAAGRTYVSNKLLGVMFRRVNEVVFENYFNSGNPDKMLKVPGSAKNLAEARRVYENYCLDVKVLLNRGQCYKTFNGRNLRIFVIS
jgi:hypothetical protein